MGMEIKLVEKVGIVFTEPLENPKDIEKLKKINKEDLSYVFNAIFLTRHALNGSVPILGLKFIIIQYFKKIITK